MPEKQPATLEHLAPIPGETYALRTELKALGAVWDNKERLWRIAPEKLPLARALVENQALAQASDTALDPENLTDPFESEAEGPRYITLSDGDGDLYAARDALKVLGARWDKNHRQWSVREEKAEYVRAVIASVTYGPNDEDTPAPVKPRINRETRKETSPRPEPVVQAPAPPTTEVKNIPMANAEPLPPAASDSPSDYGIPVTGLWRKRTASGKVYLSGQLSPTVEIRIVPNENRTREDQPLHQLYFVPVPPESEEQP